MDFLWLINYCVNVCWKKKVQWPLFRYRYSSHCFYARTLYLFKAHLNIEVSDIHFAIGTTESFTETLKPAQTSVLCSGFLKMQCTDIMHLLWHYYEYMHIGLYCLWTKFTCIWPTALSFLQCVDFYHLKRPLPSPPLLLLYDIQTFPFYTTNIPLSVISKNKSFCNKTAFYI